MSFAAFVTSVNGRVLKHVQFWQKLLEMKIINE